MVGTRQVAGAALLILGVVQSPGVVVLGPDMHDGYRGEAPPFAVDESRWLGLVAEGQGFALRPADLEWRHVEVAPGAEGARYRLSADLDHPVFLATEVLGLRDGHVEVATPVSHDLSEREPRAEVELGGRKYEWYLESAYPDECTAVVTISDGADSQAIAVEGTLGCGDPHFTIHWAGDLDSDGALDFLATFSMKYSYHPRQLYLSSAAGPGDVVGLAAMTERSAS